MKSIIFTRPKRWNPLSWAIQKITKSEASHVLVGTSVEGVPLVLHAAIGGVKFAHREKYMRSRVVVAEFIIPESVDLRNGVQLLDDAYDYGALLGHFIRRVAHLLYHTWIKNPLASSKSYLCSEFVLSLGLPAFARYTPEEVTPSDLLHAAARDSAYFTRV